MKTGQFVFMLSTSFFPDGDPLITWPLHFGSLGCHLNVMLCLNKLPSLAQRHILSQESLASSGYLFTATFTQRLSGVPSNKANHCGGSPTSNLNLSACDRCKETTGINQRLVLYWLLVNTNGKRKMNAAPSACEVFNNLTLQVLTSFTKLQTV